MSDHSRVNVALTLREAYPIGASVVPAWYFDFLCDLARLPWPRIPDTYVRFAVKMAAERKKPPTPPRVVLAHG